ncbi:hypothetical protein BCEP4_100056 [Burkholderia cepacia]|nr:hypothetical protein BCEP4_100056 [Burkholderia cepacia]
MSILRLRIKSIGSGFFKILRLIYINVRDTQLTT